MTFKDVLTWLGQHGLQDLSRLLALLRVQDVHDVMELTTEQLRDAGWPPSHIVRLRKVTHPLETEPSAASSMIVRRDITPVNPTKRGKIQSAIIASYGTHRKRTHDELTRDFYAPSCHDSRQSNWKTWCTIAEAWGLLPIPITDELVLAVGASLKNGGYRSSKNYFSRAMQEHRDHCINPLPDSTLALITRVTRSINRGIGPTTFKDSFELELFHTPLPVDERDPGVWYLHTETARDITTICCWWLLRGIEAAGAKMHHVWRQATSTANTTYFTLPIQKNDTTGMCVSRGHNCVCERNHTNPICPHCAMIRHEKRVRTLFPRSDTVPFIPEPDGSHPAKQTIIDIFRRAISNTQAHNYRDPAQTAEGSTVSLNTCAECRAHKTGLQHRRSTTHREMGIRCHQEVHPRLATDETTTGHTDQHRGAHTTTGQRPNDQILQPVLDSA